MFIGSQTDRPTEQKTGMVRFLGFLVNLSSFFLVSFSEFLVSIPSRDVSVMIIIWVLFFFF